MQLESKVRKRRVSKKTRRSWRKNISHEDVESYLEKKRENERLGDVTRLKNTELFRVETQQPILSRKERRESLKSREPRCFESLKPHSSVPDPITKRNVPKTPVSLTSKLRRKKTSNNGSSREEGQKIHTKDVRGNFEVDVWQENETRDVENSWMTPDTIRHTFGPLKKRMPISLKKKPSILPAIDLPHPGASYNPSYEDHQDLLRIVAEKELEERKKEKHLERVTSKMFCKVSQAEKEETRVKELSEGLNLDGTLSEESEEDSSNEVKSVNPPVKNEKKTRKQRRKQLLEKEMTRKRMEEKLKKRKVTDVYRLKFLEKQLAKEEKKKQILRERRLKKKELKELEPKVLSKTKYEPMDPEFQLSEELSGNLRATGTTGNLLKDRFKSLQRRNIVAPSTLQLKITKAKKKRFIKPDHKIEQLIKSK